MPRRDFNHCLAYLQIEPPEQGDNLRAASMMAQIANYAGKSLPKGKMLSADYYLGKPKEPEPMQTAQEQKSFLRGLRSKE